MVKNPPTNAGDVVQSLDWKDPLEKEMQPTAVFLPGKSGEQRRLVDYKSMGSHESRTPRSN